MNEVLDLTVTGVAHGGVMVARHQGRVVFVSDAIPGERVRARVWAVKKSFLRAETVEVLEASPERQEHVWAEASADRDPVERAGGAEFGHIRLAHQRALKEEVVREALLRQGGLDSDSHDRYPFGELHVEALPGDDESNGTEWRTRVTLHVDTNGTVGPYAAHSHRVIPVSSLPLACPELQAIAPLDGWNAEPKAASGATVSLVAPSADEARVLLDPDQTPRRSPHAPDPQGSRTGAGSGAWSGTASPIGERVGERTFQLAERAFWQVHHLAASTLSRAVQEAVDPNRFDPRAANLDLYGGVGLFAAALADGFDTSLSITSVEADPVSGFFAAKNLASCPGARSVAAQVDRFLDGQLTAAAPEERSRQTAATIVLDPPRSGAGLTVIEQLLVVHPAQIVYVACDPVAFARDTRALRAGGYELDALRAFDLFPNTHHMELVARFVP